MRQTLKKVIRYIALGALIAGLLLVAYGAIVNQVALNTFLTLLNQGGFKAFLGGILLVVASLVLLVMSFFVGRGKPAQRPPARTQEKPERRSEPEPEPIDAPYEIESGTGSGQTGA